MSDWDDGYAKGRADERKRLEVDWNGPARADIRRALLADLRAKVEALRQAAWDAYAESPGTRARYGTMASTLTSVLAMIDGMAE